MTALHGVVDKIILHLSTQEKAPSKVIFPGTCQLDIYIEQQREEIFLVGLFLARVFF